MSTAAVLERSKNQPSDDQPAIDSQADQWLMSPACDLLFLANGLWPVVFLAGLHANLAGHSSLHFWQIYFVTTPHRWVTLVLVFADPGRFRERPQAFVSVAVMVVATCLLVTLSTGTLTCLLLIDYLWNAWHFAAQHHGIYRLYARKADRSVRPDTAHKWLFRASLLYVIFRVAGWSWQFITLNQFALSADYAVATLLTGLLVVEWFWRPAWSWGRSVYFSSVTLLYLTMLWAVHMQRPDMVLVLATTSALFHAGEYLAIVSWNVQTRRKQGLVSGMMTRMSASWLMFMIAFAVALGSAGWMMDQSWVRIWLTINVMVAFLHYTYDGMIWKARRKPK